MASKKDDEFFFSMIIDTKMSIQLLGGGFKLFLIFTPTWEDSHFDEHIFERG